MKDIVAHIRRTREEADTPGITACFCGRDSDVVGTSLAYAAFDAKDWVRLSRRWDMHYCKACIRAIAAIADSQ